MPTQLFCQHQHTSCYSTLINEHNGYIWMRRYQWCLGENVRLENPARNRTGRISAGMTDGLILPNEYSRRSGTSHAKHDTKRSHTNLHTSFINVSPERYTVSGDERVQHLRYTLGPLKRKVLLLHRLTDSTVRQRLSIIITHVNTND